MSRVEQHQQDGLQAVGPLAGFDIAHKTLEKLLSSIRHSFDLANDGHESIEIKDAPESVYLAAIVFSPLIQRLYVLPGLLRCPGVHQETLDDAHNGAILV